MRAKSGILPTSVQELWCGKLWQGCFYRKLSDSVGSKKVCDKSSDMLRKIYCGRWGKKQKLLGRWAVNNNSAQQQERYAEVEYVFLQHGVVLFFHVLMVQHNGTCRCQINHGVNNWLDFFYLLSNNWLNMKTPAPLCSLIWGREECNSVRQRVVYFMGGTTVNHELDKKE